MSTLWDDAVTSMRLKPAEIVAAAAAKAPAGIEVSFEVPGVPVPQGSKTAGVAKNGRRYVRESNDLTLKPWRGTLQAAAATAWAGRPLLLGPVKVTVSFGFPRPKGHYGTKGNLLPSAPTWKATAPDLDKLQRALGDAMTGVVYRDDSQIVVWGDPQKPYEDPPFTRVRVEAL